HQEFSVGEMLREVHLLIEETEYTSIDKILNKDLLHCQLGRDVRKDIYEQLWITAGLQPWIAAGRHPCIHSFDIWSANHFGDHLPELDRIITSQPLYKKLEIGNSIETEDVKFDVGKMLKEIHRLINEATCCPKERRQQFYDSIGSIFKDLSSSELGLATKNQIFKQVWEDDNVHYFGEIIARSDESNPDVYLLKLSNIISSNPFYINPDISETVDSIELLEKDEGYASDLEGIEEKQIPLELLVEITIETVEEEANNLPNETKGKVVDDEMDTSEDDSDIIEVPIADVHFVTSAQHLNSVQTEIQEIICISDFSMEERTDAINTARRRLPDDLRWLLDGIFYELSRDPNKGGEAWADKHSAEDPSVLLEAIEELKKRIV
ncbi:MAG TPA: hypothetical protein VLG49_08165, partial [Rhabdochlamydiaceae bacterium]|nr:hypothetical protein [Rhabdochlamydiaceae bacterium]